LWANGEYGRFIYNGIDYDAVLRFQSMDIESEREIRPQGANPFNWQPPIVAEGFTAFLLSKDLYIDENRATKIFKKYKQIRCNYFVHCFRNDLIDAKRKGMEKAFMDWNKDTENRFKFSSKEVLQYLWDKDYEDKTINERDFVKDIMKAFIKSNNVCGATLHTHSIVNVILIFTEMEKFLLILSTMREEISALVREAVKTELANRDEEEAKAKEKTLFATKQLAELGLNVSNATLNRWARLGYLVPVKVGGLNFYRKEDIDRVLERKGGKYYE
jgi:hypothetical protein